jgi:hypothetical protein
MNPTAKMPMRPSYKEGVAQLVAASRELRVPVITETSPRPLLSEYASFILERMEPDRWYEPQDLRTFIPDASIDDLRAIMHELWVNRQVERVGYSGWRLQRSAPPQVTHPVSREMKVVKPEDLFDHATFPDLFK